LAPSLSCDRIRMDVYQERYLAHQARKREVLIQLMEERHSERMFAERDVEPEVLSQVLETRLVAPSSCDRRGVHVTTTTERDQKALLGGVLVGGVGWIHRAPVVLLFWGDPLAYKAGEERRWMPYIDAGVLVQQFYLMATALGLKCCYVNPNIRDTNKRHFQKVFSPLFGDFDDPAEGIFCGAMAIGWPRE
jgi:nitroreductase